MTISPILILHISAAAIGLLSGAAAMAFKKGSQRHRAAGKIFVITMLSMTAAASYLAFYKPEMISFANGILTFYLVATAWMTVKRKAGEIGLFERAGLLVAVVISVSLMAFGMEAMNSETGLKDGFPAGIYYFFGSVAAVAAAMDFKMIYRGGIYGAQRIVRHLWRMSFALLIATASFFLGQAQVIPEPVRKIEILVIPVIVVILLMVFWLFRVGFTKWYQKA